MPAKTRRYTLVFSQQYPAALENYQLLKAAPNRQFRTLLRGLIMLGLDSLQVGSALSAESETNTGKENS